MREVTGIVTPLEIGIQRTRPSFDQRFTMSAVNDAITSALLFELSHSLSGQQNIPMFMLGVHKKRASLRRLAL